MALPPKTKLNYSGFTLIELLIVIAIISILSVVGIVLFTGIQKEARDSKRRSDIDAIAKAYEIKKSNSYLAIQDNDFSSGKKPQDSDSSRGQYFNWLASDGSGFKACASLDANPNTVCNTPALNCYCKVSTQGTLNPSSPVNQEGSTNFTYGLGGSSSQSCDPNGTLLSGLVGYWKMDEGSGTTTADSSGYGNNGTLVNGASVTGGKFNNAMNFDGVDDRIVINNLPISTFATNSGPITVSLWFKPNNVSGLKYLMTDGCLEMGIATNNSTLSGIAYASVNGGTVSTTPSHGFHHAVLVHDHSPGYPSTKIRLFLDGAKSEINYTVDTGNLYIGYLDLPFHIGAHGCSNGVYQNFFAGQIDDVRIYNRALSETEVSNLFNGGNGCIPSN